MADYIVQTPIRFEGKRHEAGSTLALTGPQATTLAGLVKVVASHKPAAKNKAAAKNTKVNAPQASPAGNAPAGDVVPPETG